jgi:hypothetical protein
MNGSVDGLLRFRAARIAVTPSALMRAYRHPAGEHGPGIRQLAMILLSAWERN